MLKPAVFITGSAKRVGAAMARHFAGHGHDVALHYHHSEEEALALQTELHKTGVQCAVFQHDLHQLDALPALMEQVLSTFPHCRVLINNASIFVRTPLEKCDTESYEKHFAINFAAPVFLMKEFAALQKNAAFSIVNMLDSHITDKHSPYFMYLLSKKALAEATHMAAYELAPKGRVNGVCLGAVLPVVGTNDDTYLAKVAEHSPLKQHSTPKDVCQAVYYLAVEATSITGQQLYVDAGEHLL